MLAKVVSGGVSGVDGFLVTVECDTGPGLNSLPLPMSQNAAQSTTCPKPSPCW